MEFFVTSVPQNKQELAQAISLNATKILADYATIPEDITRISGVEGNVKGSEISVCDTLAYLIGWQNIVLKWYRLTNLGQPVDFPETGYKWNELGQLAQSFHNEYKYWGYEELIIEFQVNTAKVLSLINTLSDDELYGVDWYKKYTLGKMIQFNTSSPMKNMRVKVRKFKKNNGLI